MRDKKVDAAVARSTFPSQNVEDTPFSDHLRYSKKCTPLWREAHVQVKMLKTPHVRTTSFRCRFAWQAQGMLHAAKSEQNVRVLQQFQKRWQAWDI